MCKQKGTGKWPCRFSPIQTHCLFFPWQDYMHWLPEKQGPMEFLLFFVPNRILEEKIARMAETFCHANLPFAVRPCPSGKISFPWSARMINLTRTPLRGRIDDNCLFFLNKTGIPFVCPQWFISKWWESEPLVSCVCPSTGQNVSNTSPFSLVETGDVFVILFYKSRQLLFVFAWNNNVTLAFSPQAKKILSTLHPVSVLRVFTMEKNENLPCSWTCTVANNVTGILTCRFLPRTCSQKLLLMATAESSIRSDWLGFHLALRL